MQFTLALTLLFLVSMVGIGQPAKPDWKIDGYFGPVKRVVMERADIKLSKGKEVESKRRLAEDIEYDRGGNRLRQLSFEYTSGLLRETAIYKFIDGDQVVVFDIGNAPGAIVASSTIETPRKNYDPRYDFKFKYKYDGEGSVLEKAWWQSDGDLWLRYVYTYTGNEKSELVFDAEGKLDQKYLYKFDPNGNLIEAIIFDIDEDRPSEKIAYTYLAFDPKGNWTKRSEAAGEKEDGFKKKPREMTYRKIIYYVGGETR